MAIPGHACDLFSSKPLSVIQIKDSHFGSVFSHHSSQRSFVQNTLKFFILNTYARGPLAIDKISGSGDAITNRKRFK